MARHITDFGGDRRMSLYQAACVCLLVAAAGLRFHDLAEHHLRPDEALVADFSQGTLSEIVSSIRCCHSSPILYPLILRAVQQVESTIFSIRIVPALASVLTIAVMLFLLPRLGVARGAAFLAALLATLSVEAIRHAQDAREYSVDALVALLMVAGLLRHLRDGGRALLCACLFVAPLVQYGLALFGAAVTAAAMVSPPQPLAAPKTELVRRTREWAKLRVAWAWPAVCLLAGCSISYAVTLRHQPEPRAVVGYLSQHYFRGDFDVLSIFGFSIDGVWSLLTYHLPAAVAMAALAAFAGVLVAAFLGRTQGTPQARAILVAFSFCIAVAVAAAVLGLYPLGGVRQAIHLGPIVFLAVGVAFHWTAGCLSSLARRRWTMPVLLAMAGGTALAGADALLRDLDGLYWPHDRNAEILAALQERAQEGDAVYLYAFGQLQETWKFHQREPIRQVVIDGRALCRRDDDGAVPPPGSWRGSSERCFQAMATAISRAGGSRLWLVSQSRWHSDLSALRALQLLAADVSIEHVVSGGRPNLYLIEDTAPLIEVAAADALQDIRPTLPRKPSIRSTFDVYLRDDMLIYFKEPCARADTEAWFFLHLFPADAADLPDHRRPYGFDNLDFDFAARGVMSDGRCTAMAALPEHGLSRIRTGQVLADSDGSSTRLWEGEVRFAE